MTQVYSTLCVSYFPGDSRHCRFIMPFSAVSNIVGKFSIPVDFICDFESVPVIKGTNNEAGAVHDYFSRYNSIPVVSKLICARLYLEFQAYYDALERPIWSMGKVKYILDIPCRAWDFVRRWVKTGIVLCAPGYFHRLSVEASYDQVCGLTNVEVY